MKVKSNDRCMIIPKELLEGFEEVEISRKNGFIVIIPTSKRDSNRADFSLRSK
jgi:hypothetical protein